jgi:hypothetical protein
MSPLGKLVDAGAPQKASHRGDAWVLVQLVQAVAWPRIVSGHHSSDERLV